MKKRLLSAALALAMVLTMLPLTAFAASGGFIKPTNNAGTTMNVSWTPQPSNAAPETMTYYAQGATFQGFTINSAGWYSAIKSPTAGTYSCHYILKNSTFGVTTASIPSTGWTTGNSGTWYPTVASAVAARATNITLLGGDSLDASNVVSGTLSINLNGSALSISGTTPKGNSFSTLNISDTAATKGMLTGSITAKNKGFALSVTGTNNGSNNLAVDLDNTGDSATAAQSFTLQVTVDGAKIGAITTKNSKGNINVRNNGSTGAITLGQSFDKENRSGGSVTLATRAAVSSVFIAGTGTLSMSGMSSVTGNVSLFGGNATSTNNGAVPTWNGTTVTIDGTSTVLGSINQANTDLAGKHSITVQNRSTVNTGITLNQGGSNTVKISDSTVGSTGIKMVRGSLTVTNSSIAGIEAAAPVSGDVATDGLSITVGTRNQADTSNTGNINRVGGNKIIPALTINGGTVGKIQDNGSDTNMASAYSIELWGGTTGTAIPKESLKGGLAEGYVIKKGMTSTPTYFYTTNFQDLIDQYEPGVSSSINNAYRVNDDTVTATQRVVFIYEKQQPLAEIGITPGTYVMLPTKVNNTEVKYWHDTSSWADDSTKEALEAGKRYQFPSSGDIVLAVQLTPNNSNVVTGVTAVDNKDSTPIGCTLSGNTINLSGAVNTTGDTATVLVTFTMNDGSTRQVTVGWATDGTTTVSKVGNANDGVVLPTLHGNTVQVYNVTYTFNGSGLRSKVSGITVGNLTSVPLSVPNASAGMSGAFVELGKELQKTLTNSPSLAKFDDAAGVKMALNALIASQTESTLNSIVSQARNAMVAYDNRVNAGGSNTHKVTDAQYTGYRYVMLVPYLEISSSNPTTTTGTSANPILTLNITLKYRYTVTNALGGGDVAYKDKDASGNWIDWEQTGNLNVTGDYGTVAITLKMPANLAFSDSVDSYAHHNGYVYTMDWTSQVATITNVNGFSPFVINNTAPAVTITPKSGSYAYGFDNLQTAVDAVKDGETIVMHENFTGSINLTGTARKFTLKSDPAKKVTVNLTGVNGASTTYEFKASSNEYEIQLAASTVTPSGNVTIGVASVANGYARVSATSVKPGAVVTITAVPNAGYAATTPSVRYSTNAAASNVLGVTAVGANTWSFTVPANATGVTVTPGFVQITTTTNVPYTDVAANAWYYTGVEYCYNTIRGSSRLMQGMNDSNTIFSPNSGFTRAQVVQILWNMKGRPSPTNTYNRFSDISSIHYAYNAMLWAVQNGYAEGYPDGTFRPNQYVTRQEMAVFLWRAAGKPTNYGAVNLNNYNDGNQVYDWAQAAMRWAVATGVLSGQGSVSVGRYLVPRAVAYRSEVAVTVMNFDKLAVFR